MSASTKLNVWERREPEAVCSLPTGHSELPTDLLFLGDSRFGHPPRIQDFGELVGGVEPYEPGRLLSVA